AVGLAAMTAPWVGPAGGGLAETVRAFLDGSGAPLRNVHKFEPLLRLPIVLGVAHLLAQLCTRVGGGRRGVAGALAHPERGRSVAVAVVGVVAAAAAAAPAWLGRLAPVGAHEKVPDHWPEAAAWLAENAPVPAPAGGGASGADPGAAGPATDPAATTRALVVPGASF